MSFLLTMAVVLATAAPPSPSAPPGNAACLDCHAAPQKSVVAQTYNQSPHGVLSCERCHAEAAGPAHAKDPDKPLGIPEDRAGLAEYSSRCLKCHAAVETAYNKSFHGIAVKMGDTRAATCVDCHGVHDVFGARDTRSLVNPANLAKTCATAECHQGAPENFAKGREHVDPTKPGEGTDGWQHLIWKFFIGLILFDVMKDGPIVMFELLRRIRG